MSCCITSNRGYDTLKVFQCLCRDKPSVAKYLCFETSWCWWQPVVNIAGTRFFQRSCQHGSKPFVDWSLVNNWCGKQANGDIFAGKHHRGVVFLPRRIWIVNMLAFCSSPFPLQDRGVCKHSSRPASAPDIAATTLTWTGTNPPPKHFPCHHRQPPPSPVRRISGLDLGTWHLIFLQNLETLH